MLSCDNKPLHRSPSKYFRINDLLNLNVENLILNQLGEDWCRGLSRFILLFKTKRFEFPHRCFLGGQSSSLKQLWPISSLFSSDFIRRRLTTPHKILKKCLEIDSMQKFKI